VFCQDSPLNQLLFSASMTSFHTAYLPSICSSGTSFPKLQSQLGSPVHGDRECFSVLDHQTSLYSLLRLPFKVSHDHFLGCNLSCFASFCSIMSLGPNQHLVESISAGSCLHVEAKGSSRKQHTLSPVSSLQGKPTTIF